MGKNRHKLTVDRAQAHELKNFPSWAAMAGANHGADLAAILLDAHGRHLLGSALDADSTGMAVRRLAESYGAGGIDAAVWPRTCALTLRLDDDVIGAALTGPSVPYLRSVAQSSRQDPLGGLTPLLFGATKLHLIAVDPQHQAHGHGAGFFVMRWMRHADPGSW